MRWISMNEYMVTKRLEGQTLCGYVKLPYGTLVDLDENHLFYKGQMLCRVTSQIAKDHFSRNDDNLGEKRGELVKKIQNRLKKVDHHQERWDKIWADLGLRKFKRDDFDDYWLWNDAFYQAPIEDLEYIWKLICNI